MRVGRASERGEGGITADFFLVAQKSKKVKGARQFPAKSMLPSAAAMGTGRASGEAGDGDVADAPDAQVPAAFSLNLKPYAPRSQRPFTPRTLRLPLNHGSVYTHASVAF